VTVERTAAGTPRKGNVQALIAPYLDDGPIFTGGTIAKLPQESRMGDVIRTSNDGRILSNSRWVIWYWPTSAFRGVVRVSGSGSRSSELPNSLDGRLAPAELHARLIFLFRLLKVETIFSYDL
jgi:hypothetical protein